MARTARTDTASRAPLIRMAAGRPVLLCAGRAVPQSAYSDYITWSPEYRERIAEFAANGVRLFHLAPHSGETLQFWGFAEAGAKQLADWPSRLTLAQQAEVILQACPDAQLFIRPSSTVPAEWAAAHPQDMQTDEDGQTHADATLASPRYLADVAAFCERLVEHCESRWGDRIVGYLDAPLGEGCMPLVIAGKMFDCSPASEVAFRAWLERRYGSDAALAAAWNQPGLTLTAARVPRDHAWLERRRTAGATIGGQPAGTRSLPSNSGVGSTGLFHWLEADNAPAEHDYCRYQRDAFLAKFRHIARSFKTACAARGRRRLVGFDVTKQPLLGWQILSAFDGIGDGQSFPNLLALSGSWDSGELLDDPDIDLIFTPADYHARTLGFAYEAEGVSDSLLLRGKAMVVENDARNYVGQGMQDQGAFRTDREVEAGLRRNAAFTLSRGLQSYWCNVGSSYFHAPGIQKVVGTLVPVLDRWNERPHRETRDAVALVIDDESVLCEDLTSGYQTLAVIWQRILGLAHCGVPYRILLLSDLRRDTLPAYRTWLFPNLFIMNDERLRLLRRRVLREGNVALFGPATGISDGRHLGPDGAAALLGVPFELLPRTTVRHVIVQDPPAGHPLTRALPAALTYGDSLPYGPTLVPQEWAVEKSGGVPLGHATACWFIHRTGLFLKEFGRGAAGNGRPGARGPDDYAALWSVAMPLPANLLREAARFAGSHVWCEEDDVVYASESIAALHSVKGGLRTLRLPRRCTVRDAFSGRVVGRATDRVRFRITPPETRIFELED